MNTFFTTMAKQVQPEEEVKQVVEAEEPEFKIEQLFGSKTRVALLGLFLENPERAFYVRELTRRIDAQLNSVRRELQNLVSMKIILEVEGSILDQEKDPADKGTPDQEKKKRAAKKKFYQANTSFIFFDELRAIMKKSSILIHKSVVRELSKKGEIDLLFMTGKFVDDTSIPSDLLIVGDVQPKVLEKAIETFEKKIGWEINYTYMPREEFTYRREVKDRFLGSIMTSEKIVLIDKIRTDV